MEDLFSVYSNTNVSTFLCMMEPVILAKLYPLYVENILEYNTTESIPGVWSNLWSLLFFFPLYREDIVDYCIILLHLYQL
jgi:hypothetical protein